MRANGLYWCAHADSLGRKFTSYHNIIWLVNLWGLGCADSHCCPPSATTWVHKTGCWLFRKRTQPSKRKAGRFKCWSVWSLVSGVQLKAGVRGFRAFNHSKQKLKYGILCYSDASQKNQRCFSPLNEKWREDSSSTSSYFSFYTVVFKYFDLCFHSGPSNEHLRVFSQGNLRGKQGEREVPDKQKKSNRTRNDNKAFIYRIKWFGIWFGPS